MAYFAQQMFQKQFCWISACSFSLCCGCRVQCASSHPAGVTGQETLFGFSASSETQRVWWDDLHYETVLEPGPHQETTVFRYWCCKMWGENKETDKNKSIRRTNKRRFGQIFCVAACQLGHRPKIKVITFWPTSNLVIFCVLIILVI